MGSALPYIPLLILLIILFFGCAYYVYQLKVTLNQILKMIKEKEEANEFKNRSLTELEDLLHENKILENFEQCALIRDEITRRIGYKLDNELKKC
jgi:protein-arginine kinase activator protein McsA